MLLPLALAAALALPHQAFDLRDLQRDQRGTCYTVFEGDRVEPFDFVVKGAMKNFLGPQKDVVLIKLLGERVALTGVAAGMSGSPCVLEGKLLGALAYSFSIFAKEPIAGITPIESMREVLRLPVEARDWRQLAASPAASSDASPTARAPWAFERSAAAAQAWLQPAPAVDESSADAAGLQPIATPLSLGGVSSSVRQAFAPWLQQQGFAPLAAAHAGHVGHASPAARPSGPAQERLVPGGSVAAILVSGDVDVAATGTVTTVTGRDVLAFGHPFMSSGAVSLPLAQADILNVMASSMRSFKMSVTGPVVGELTQDRLTAIAGRLGQHAATVSVSGWVKTPAGTSPIELHIARDPQMTPRLLAMSLAGSLTGRVGANQRGTVRYRAELRRPDAPPVVLTNVHAGQRDSGLLSTAAVDVARAFAALWEAPFGPPPLLSVYLEVAVQPEPIEEFVESLSLGASRVHPGDSVEVAVRLRRRDTGPHSRAGLPPRDDGQATFIERFTLEVPRRWAGRQLRLQAGGAAAADRQSLEVEGLPQPHSLAEMGALLAQRRHAGALYLQVVRPGVGLQAGGQALPFLPPSMVATLQHEDRSSRLSSGVDQEVVRPRPGVVVGRAQGVLEVLAQ